MSCTSAIYAANTTTQAVPANTQTTINFGQVVRAFGPYTRLSGGNVTVRGAGYYIVDTNFSVSTVEASAGVTIQLYKDGVAIPGAAATFTTAANSGRSDSIPLMIRETCCKESTITATITSTVAATVTNAAILIKKV